MAVKRDYEILEGQKESQVTYTELHTIHTKML